MMTGMHDPVDGGEVPFIRDFSPDAAQGFMALCWLETQKEERAGDPWQKWLELSFSIWMPFIHFPFSMFKADANEEGPQWRNG